MNGWNRVRAMGFALALQLVANVAAGAPVYLSQWGTPGQGVNQFSSPYAIATNSAGEVYVADTFNNRIKKFSREGNLLITWGSAGTGDGQLTAPTGIACAPNGNVYVTESSNRVQYFDPNGQFIGKWGASGSGNGQFNLPRGIGIDASGNVFVVEQLGARVQKFDANGTFLLKWGSSGAGDGQLSQAWGLDVDGAGSVFVSETGNSRIQVFTGSGVFLRKWGSFGTGYGQFRNPRGIEVTPSGHVLVADMQNGRVQEFSSSGAFLQAWGSTGTGNGQFVDLQDIAVGNGSDLYVADTGNHRIQRFASELTFNWPSAANSSVPTRVLMGASGSCCFDVVVRDLASNPLSGCMVVVALEDCLVSLCPDQPGVIEQAVYATTDASGTAHFCICVPSATSGCTASIYANGVPLASHVPVRGCPASACPTPTWSLVEHLGPAPRAGHAMSDDGTGHVVMFGGRNAPGVLGDQWSWNGLEWSQQFPATSPAARDGHAMVFDRNRGRVVLFGGRSASGSHGDTWEWNGTNWALVSIEGNGPQPRHSHVMAYDANRKQVVMYGGTDDLDLFDDTWVWDGSSWSIVQAGAPPARKDAAAAYDPMTGHIVLMGGETFDGPLSRMADTWEWDGTAWAQVDLDTYGAHLHPTARSGHSMVFAPNCGRPIMVGSGGVDGSTWRWRGADWAVEGPSIAGVEARDAAIAFDPVRRQPIVFGGSVPLHVTTQYTGSTYSLCSPCDAEAAELDSTGQVILPPGADLSDPPVTIDIDEVTGDVRTLYPDFETGTDLWFPRKPCPPAIGGQAPPEATYGALLDSLRSLGPELDGVFPEEIADSLSAWNKEFPTDTLAVDSLDASGPVSGSFSEPAPRTRPPGCYVFGGRDIVFVHGLMPESILDAILGNAPPEWEQPDQFPHPGTNPSFYDETGYWKAKAKSYWASHIQRFFTSRNIKNRYLIVSWPSTQKLDVAAQAVLTQIADAMGPDHVGVVDPDGGSLDGFGSTSYVVVSHSTGSLVTDVAMASAKRKANLEAEYIADHCKGHIALHGAFAGTDIATYTIKALEYLTSGSGPPWMDKVGNVIGVLNMVGAVNTHAAKNSVLSDLVPPRAQRYFGRKYVRKSPVRTVTVTGGHPTEAFPIKHIIEQGYDDGVIHVNSADANPNLSETFDPIPPYRLWPSGFFTFPLLGHLLNYDMGNEPERSVPLYFDLVLDPIINKQPLAIQTYGSYLSSGPVPFLTPLGMETSVLFDPSLFDFFLFGYPVGIGGQHRFPNHFSYLDSPSEHVAPLGNFGNYPHYKNAWERIGGTVRNDEETRVITDSDIYSSYSTNGEPATALLDENHSPVVEERVKGKRVEFTVRIPPLIKFKVGFWVWRRAYYNVQGWQSNHEVDYVYRYILSDGSNYPCSTQVVSVPGSGAAARLALGRVFPTPGRGPTQVEFMAPAVGQVTMEVYDLAGRLVQRAIQRVEAGLSSWTWNGVDLSGRPTHPGLFLVRARWSDERGAVQYARARMVRVK